MDPDLLLAGWQFGTSLGIGLLIGLDRERKGDSRGLRTFALVSLLGALAGALSRDLGQPVLVPIGLAAVVAIAIAAYWHDHARAVALPLLPDRAYGPHGSLNPYEIWLMVVLVAGVGLAGYLLLRFAGQRHGAPLAAVAGGLVSSTATTLVFARHARAGGGAAQQALLVMLANLTMLLRLGIMAAVVSPRLLPGIATVIAAALLATAPFALWLAPRARRERDQPLPVVRNPRWASGSRTAWCRCSRPGAPPGSANGRSTRSPRSPGSPTSTRSRCPPSA
jgi:uncharacterized membrane protein (DUF4010 family)